MVRTGLDSESGHWYAIVKEPNSSRWIKCDDSREFTEPIKLDAFLRRRPTSLFYQKRTQHLDVAPSQDGTYFRHSQSSRITPPPGKIKGYFFSKYGKKFLFCFYCRT
jgi:hypothetical protein